MVVSKYPADFGHTNVIDNLSKKLIDFGYRVGIGALSFEYVPKDVEVVKLNRYDLLKNGVSNLDFDIIHAHQPRVLYYLLKKMPNKPVLLHYHGIANKIQEKNLLLALKLFNKKISRIISVSDYGVTVIRKLSDKIKIDVIENGVDTNHFSPMVSKKYPRGPKLMYVGGLYKHKQVPQLINYMSGVIKKHPDSHLQIIGEGMDLAKVQNLIKKNDLARNIELLGKINNHDLPPLYAECDVYVSASSLETYPLPPLEAMSCGKPVVLSDIEPHRDMIKMSGAGYTFTDAQDFVEKISKVYQNRVELGLSGRRYAEQHDWKLITQKIISLYNEITS